MHYAFFPSFDTLPDGTRCVRTVRRAYASPLAAAVAQDSRNILSNLDYPPCPGTPRPAVTPAGEAASFWRVSGEDLLAKPEPRIAPGYMLAGKRAYLEARTVPSATFTHPTPLGLLTIEARSGAVYVDWGDGAGLRGPYDGPGRPWPHGEITHVWTNAATYDVRVQQRWTATWRLATGESGSASRPIYPPLVSLDGKRTVAAERKTTTVAKARAALRAAPQTGSRTRSSPGASTNTASSETSGSS